MHSLSSAAATGLRSGVFAAMLLGAAAIPALAQQTMPPQQEIPDSIQELMDEFRQAEERFNQIQSQAMEDNPELQERQEEIGEMVNEAILEIDPEAEERMARLGEIEQEAMAAQQQEDMGQFQALVMEAQEIQQRLQMAQAEALERDEIRVAIETFQEDVLEAMMEIDPASEELLERLQELAEQLSGGIPGEG